MFIMLLILFLVAQAAQGSVVGVTYRDDFDFEERYSNDLHCDPFFWYPLHLPEDCQEKFQKQIINKILGLVSTTESSVSEGKSEEIDPREQFFIRSPYTNTGKVRNKRESYFDGATVDFGNRDGPFDHDRPFYPITGSDEDADEGEYLPREVKKYNDGTLDALESLNADIALNPILPQLQMTNMGPVAIYQQPVGKITARRIESLSQFNRERRKKKHGVRTTIKKVLKNIEKYNEGKNNKGRSIL